MYKIGSFLFCERILLKRFYTGGCTMKIDDELLDKLGTYFVYHELYNRYGLTFETFVDRWTRGILEL